MVRRGAIVFAGLLSALALAGCYGSTEPASDIGETRATLHGQGTANNGPAYSYFLYHAPFLGAFAQDYTTPRRSWPAGTSGSFGEPVTGLEVATQYTFSLCGGDQGQVAQCAQERTFTTATPAGDYVRGDFFFFFRAGELFGSFNAFSELASGAQAQGTISIPLLPATGLYPQQYTGRVTCLAVHGNSALIGAVDANGSYLKLTVVNGGQRYGYEQLGTATRPDCSKLTPVNLSQTPAETSVVVHDVP